MTAPRASATGSSRSAASEVRPSTSCAGEISSTATLISRYGMPQAKPSPRNSRSARRLMLASVASASDTAAARSGRGMLAVVGEEARLAGATRSATPAMQASPPAASAIVGVVSAAVVPATKSPIRGPPATTTVNTPLQPPAQVVRRRDLQDRRPVRRADHVGRAAQREEQHAEPQRAGEAERRHRGAVDDHGDHDRHVPAAGPCSPSRRTRTRSASRSPAPPAAGRPSAHPRRRSCPRRPGTAPAAAPAPSRTGRR